MNSGEYKNGNWTNVPSWSSVVGLSSVVIPLSVTAHIQDFVLHETSTASVETPDIVLELLPLRPRWIDFIIGWIRDVQKSKVGGGLSYISTLASIKT